MSTENEAIRAYALESIEGFDAVIDRMLRCVGNPAAGSAADALDVPANTLKTWRRRGAVPMRALDAFAKAHGVSIDYLRFGIQDEVQDEPAAPMPGLFLLDEAHHYKVDAGVDKDTAAAIKMVGDELRAAGQLVNGDRLLALIATARRYIAQGRELERKARRGSQAGKSAKASGTA